MSLPGDENPKPQWTSGNPLGDQADESPRWQQPPPQSEWQREPAPTWQQPQSPYAGWVSPPRTPGQAYAAMILGIVGLFPICPVILSVIALILGFTAKAEIERSNGQLGGSGIALAGIITGGVGAVLYILFFLAIFTLGST
jgi:hypothetical protein